MRVEQRQAARPDRADQKRLKALGVRVFFQRRADQEGRDSKPSIYAGCRGGVGSLWVSRGRVTLGEPATEDNEHLCSDIEQVNLSDM
jgi:hypothetical protein